MFSRNNLDSDKILHGSAYRKRFEDTGDPIAICEHCQEELYELDSVAESDGLLFCSMGCARAYFRIREIESTETNICCNCNQVIDGKEYETYASKLTGELFCSEDCAEEYFNIKMTRIVKIEGDF